MKNYLFFFRYGIISIIRSFFFCLIHLKLSQAIKVPILITFNVKTIKVKGRIRIDSPKIQSCQIIIGQGGSAGLHSFNSCILIEKDSEVVFKGKAIMAKGTVLRVDEGAHLEIGEDFYCNNNCFFRCSDTITIGNHVTFGWYNYLNDNDGHSFIKDGKEIVRHGPISIGNHVWITTNCKINKGVVIPDECVVTQSSVVNRKDFVSHSLIGGIPAKIIETGIAWHE